MKKNLILIEDDDALREGLALILIHQQYQVRAFPDNAHFQKFKNLPVDIYLIDYRLPGANGLTITQNIRRRAAGKATPIIILSASGDNLPDKARSAGANAFIRKPFEISDLIIQISRLLNP